MNGDDKTKEIFFDLADDALYVANGGHPFTRKGVIGICAYYLSEKISQSTDNDSDDFEAEDKDLVTEIRRREIITYTNDKKRLTSDSGGETETYLDYEARFVWELFQNVDDTMGPNDRLSASLIGSKGLGFKSVLEITDEPEIHSGPFNFRFSSDETQKLLKDELSLSNPPRLTFRIPHSYHPNDKVRKLRDAGYSTIIRLPFRDGTARGKALHILKTLEPQFLLLSQQLEIARIILDEKERLYRIERECPGFSDGKVMLYSPDGQMSWRRWVATGHVAETECLTAAIAIPLDENGEAVPHTDELPFHVFFPTEEQLGVNALIHASFDLEQNRKHLRSGGHDKELLELFSNILKRVILDVPARTTLETFGPIVSHEGHDGGLLEKIKKTIQEMMQATSFVPVLGSGRLPPTATKLWEDDLGKVLREDVKDVQDAALVTPDLSDLFNVLKNLGATEIEYGEYLRLLRYCRNKSLEDCLSSFQALVEGGLKRVPQGGEKDETFDPLREVPCWWTEDERARPLSAERPLLWEKPEDWPRWLVADTLHPEFQKEIKKWEERLKEVSEGDRLSKKKKWESLTNRFLSRKREHYTDWVLVPFVEEWKQQDWEQQGFRALKMLALWEARHDFDQIDPWIKGEEGRRNKLSTVLHLPTDKGWLPAINCFAGKDWDGPEAFVEFFRNRKGHGIVQPFKEWPEDLQQGASEAKWKGLLRWIGVSWEPKVYRTSEFYVSHPLWEEYSRNKQNPRRREGSNYSIQYFPNCIRDIGKTKLIRDILPALIKLAKKQAKRPKSRDKNVSSLALHQLRKEAWLPVKKSLLEDRFRIPPNEAFLPDKGLGGLLPEVEVDRSVIDNNIWYGEAGIESMLRALGVMESLPNKGQKWHDWMRRLAETAGNLPEEDREAPPWKGPGANDLWRAARSLYREYRKLGISESFPGDIKIPCVCLESGRRTLNFTLPEKVHWIDEPYLMDPALENSLLSQKYNLFIFRLKAAGLMERLGVQKLSNIVKCNPRFSPSGDNATDMLHQRYKVRRSALEKVAKIQLPETLDIKAATNLILDLSANGKILPPFSVLSWREEETNFILVDTEKNKWKALAHALAHRLDDGRYADHADTFEVYLAEDDDEEVLDRLRNAGIPEEALEEVEKGFQSPTPNEKSKEETEEEEERNRATSDDKPSPTDHSDPGSGYKREPGGHQRPGSGDRSSDPRPDVGLEAEHWLEKQLRAVWPEVKNVKEGRDLVLSIGGRTIHIEAKHVENPPGVIHWSDKQYELAEQTSSGTDSYLIAILSPDHENQYAIHWVWNPLEQLKGLERKMTWSGKRSSASLRNGYWNLHEVKLSEPSWNFHIDVKLDDGIFSKENQDSPQLEKFRGKFESRG